MFDGELVDGFLLFEELEYNLDLEGGRIAFAHGRNCTLSNGLFQCLVLRVHYIERLTNLRNRILLVIIKRLSNGDFPWRVER